MKSSKSNEIDSMRISVGRGDRRNVKSSLMTGIASPSPDLNGCPSASKVSSGVAVHQLVAMTLPEKRPEYLQNESVEASIVALPLAFRPGRNGGRAGIALNRLRFGRLRGQNGRGA